MSATIESFVNCNTPPFHQIQYRLNGTGSYSTITLTGWRNFAEYLSKISSLLQSAGVNWTLSYSTTTDRVTFRNNASATYQFQFTVAQAKLLGFSGQVTASTASDFSGDLAPFGVCPITSLHIADNRPAKNADVMQFRHGATHSVPWGGGTLHTLNMRALYANQERIAAGPCGVGKVRVGDYGASTVFSSSAVDGYLDVFLMGQNSINSADRIENTLEASFKAFKPETAHNINETFSDSVFNSLKAGFSFIYYARIEGLPFIFTEKSTGVSSSAYASHTEKAYLVLNPDTKVSNKLDRFKGIASGTGLSFGILDPTNATGIFKRPSRSLQLGTTAFDIDDTTITVDQNSGDFAGFASSGAVYLGKERLTYTGKTSNTFTGVTRGTFGEPYEYTTQGASQWKTVTDDAPTTWVGRIVEVWAGLCDPFGNPVFADFDDQYCRQIFTGSVDAFPGFENGVWSISCQDLLKRLESPVASSANGKLKASLIDDDLGTIPIYVADQDTLIGRVMLRHAGTNDIYISEYYNINILDELQAGGICAAGSSGVCEYRQLLETVFDAFQDLDISTAVNQDGDTVGGGDTLKAKMSVRISDNFGNFRSEDGAIKFDVTVSRTETNYLGSVSGTAYNLDTGEDVYYWRGAASIGTDSTTPPKSKKATGSYTIASNPTGDFVLTTNGIAETITPGVDQTATETAIVNAINTAAAGDPGVSAANSAGYVAAITADEYGESGNDITLDVTSSGGGIITAQAMSGGEDGDLDIEFSTGLHGKTAEQLFVHSMGAVDWLVGAFSSNGFVSVGTGKETEVVKYGSKTDLANGLIRLGDLNRDIIGTGPTDFFKKSGEVNQALSVQTDPGTFATQMIESTGTGSAGSPGPRGSYDVFASRGFGYGLDSNHVLDASSDESLNPKTLTQSMPLPANMDVVITGGQSFTKYFSGLLMSFGRCLGWVRSGQRLKMGAIPTRPQGSAAESLITISDDDLALTAPVSTAYVAQGPNIVKVNRSKTIGDEAGDKLTFRLLGDIDAKGGKQITVNLFGVNDTTFKALGSTMAMGIINGTPYQVAYSLKVAPWLDWQVGSRIKFDAVSFAGVWDWNNGSAGLTGFGRVMEIERNLSTQEVTAVVLVEGQQASYPLCPVGVVTSNSGADLTVSAPSIFAENDPVLVYTPGIAASYEERTISSIAGAVLTLDSTPSVVVNNFTIVTYPSDNNAAITTLQDGFCHVSDGGGWES